jgi:hypothetical protein
MPNHVAGINAEIIQLKALLENTAQKYQYNFRHPKVLLLSQRLDGLILEVMKSQSQQG